MRDKEEYPRPQKEEGASNFYDVQREREQRNADAQQETPNGRHKNIHHPQLNTHIGGVARWSGRWSLAVGLSRIYGRHVTTSWVVSAMGQPTRPTQPFTPSGSVNE